ncbi:MAG TPA: zinc-ribbon domain-containing protein [Bacteroidia bacterium]|nr:zinc-ribbon domain-containing protein [Bacteroidia bacterium]
MKKITNQPMIEEMQKIAKEHGGKCLSKEYINQYTPLKWMCSKGHTWEGGPYLVKRGYWCVVCLKEEDKQERLEQMKIFAKKKDGRCLSVKYINADTKLKWECSRRHIWEERFSNLKNRGGNWCIRCKEVDRRKFELKKMKAIAEKRGGKCLSDKYINKCTKLTWQCSKGHSWKATPGNVDTNHSWCMICSGKLKYTIEDMQKLAKIKGGLCLSLKYFDRSTKLTWKCKKGHTWKAQPNAIINEQWCPACGLEASSQKQRSPIEELRTLAKKRNGKLLSADYINGRIPVMWQCKKGHKWKARYSDVKNKHSWCPHCALENRRSGNAAIIR